ncbi:hypothetical protein [Sporosarcina pasteurii]|uniref:Phage shock protein B n=1 Tax=Sporosarcina pasteurii TaxID=1474 RepID=A0A380C230_SPOPA|nr:hypothetical protein [Sporosarcina pasteurii]MDS9471602.1 hypothetical protein [Sporosarcina pasteurii]QBQ04786.1 hypothetical protein E2C16_03460 [Sporosarcina pasteurii]SUJ11265.1 Uncharacterised protein [Sporosarcina pasteurii]
MMMWGDRMHGHGMGMFSVWPLLFWLVIIILIVLLIIRLTKNNPGQSNELLYQKLADSEQLQRESLRRQQELTDELREVHERLKRVEKRLKDRE